MRGRAHHKRGRGTRLSIRRSGPQRTRRAVIVLAAIVDASALHRLIERGRVRIRHPFIMSEVAVRTVAPHGFLLVRRSRVVAIEHIVTGATVAHLERPGRVLREERRPTPRQVIESTEASHFVCD